MEFLQQGNAREDEDRAKHQGPEDAPEQHLMLINSRHLEIGKISKTEWLSTSATFDEIAAQN
jgi:hypothetical protein